MGVLSRGQFLVPVTSSLSELSWIGGVTSPAVGLGMSGISSIFSSRLASDWTTGLGG